VRLLGGSQSTEAERARIRVHQIGQLVTRADVRLRDWMLALGWYFLPRRDEAPLARGLVGSDRQVPAQPRATSRAFAGREN
jgi:hypothetical protein